MRTVLFEDGRVRTTLSVGKLGMELLRSEPSSDDQLTMSIEERQVLAAAFAAQLSEKKQVPYVPDPAGFDDEAVIEMAVALFAHRQSDPFDEIAALAKAHGVTSRVSVWSNN